MIGFIKENRQAALGAGLVAAMFLGFLVMSGSLNVTSIGSASCDWQTLEIDGQTFDSLPQLEQAIQDNTQYNTIEAYASTAEEASEGERNIEFREGPEGMVEVTKEC